jgi:hypothetical protein
LESGNSPDNLKEIVWTPYRRPLSILPGWDAPRKGLASSSPNPTPKHRHKPFFTSLVIELFIPIMDGQRKVIPERKRMHSTPEEALPFVRTGQLSYSTELGALILL